MGISTANLKKVHNGRVVNEVLFGAKCEDYSLEDSISDSPEKLFQRPKEPRTARTLGTTTGRES